MSKPDKPEAAETPAPTPEELKALEAKAKLAQEYYDQLLRLKAEFENFRKRADKEKPELVRFGRAEILAKLLPLYDVLIQAHEEVQKMESESVTPLAKGMELIFKEFAKLFESEGLTIFIGIGKPYDHERQDVIGTVERDDMPEGTVVEVLQPGYILKDKVLRHAKVRISKKQPEGG